MQVLVVVGDVHALAAKCSRCSTLVAEGADVAVCYVTPSAKVLAGMLEAQRTMTAALRRALDGSAEKIAVFVVSGEAGDGVEECARAWGATVVEQ